MFSYYVIYDYATDDETIQKVLGPVDNTQAARDLVRKHLVDNFKKNFYCVDDFYKDMYFGENFKLVVEVNDEDLAEEHEIAEQVEKERQEHVNQCKWWKN